MGKKISAFTELATLPATTDLFLLELASGGAYRKIKWSNLVADGSISTAKLADSSVTSAKVAAGMPVQMVATSYTAVATGTTAIPRDDTIPQNTEGTELMTQAITPKSATNILVIEAHVMLANTTTSTLMAALFQDSTANALAVSTVVIPDAAAYNTPRPAIVRHTMVAGTTSATTFKIRAGGNGGGTMTFNGSAGAREFGAITKSSFTITEYKA